MSLVKFLVVIILLSFPVSSFGSNGQKGYVLTSSFNFFNTSTESSARPTFKDTDSFVDIKLGYTIDSGFYFGALLTSFSDSDENRMGYGPMLGFSYMGFFVGASYLINVEHEVTTESLKLRKGTGYTAEVGYSYPWFDHLSVGANITYMSISYSEVEYYTGITSSVTDHKEYFFVPMLQVSLFFSPKLKVRPAFR